jgi:6-phosphofructokinase 1
MKKIALFTSGGDAPGMNAGIRAIVRSAIAKGVEVFGIQQGYQGMIENKIIPMDSRSVSGIIQRGGTILGSARSKAFRTPEGRAEAYQNLKAHGIEGIVVIGGDGSFTGAKIFMEEYPDIAIVGMPGTIDNDLYGTDYTIGYDTAINTAMQAVDKIRDTADAHNRLFFIELMGRDAGFISLRTGIATGAEAILVPETETKIEELIAELNAAYDRKKNSAIVIVAEGDDAGNAFQVAEAVKGKVPYEDIRVTVLGHLQRGGSPTCMDRVLASQLGVAAVKALFEGQKGVMLGIQHKKAVAVPFEQAIKHNQVLSPQLLELAKILSL